MRKSRQPNTRTVEGRYEIVPAKIILDGEFPLIGTFGHRETELAAIFIIKLCQQKGEWAALTHEEIDEVYAKTEEGKWQIKHNLSYQLVVGKYRFKNLFCFYDLVPNLIERGQDGKYRVTKEFIIRCFLKSYDGKKRK